MKTRVLSFILSFLVAVPKAFSAPMCEDVFATRTDRTEQTVMSAVQETAALFRLSEKKIERLRERIRKEIEKKSPSEKLRTEKILKAVDKLLESRWMNWKDLVKLDSEALTRRIVVQEKLMADLRADLEKSGDFESAEEGAITKARLRLINATNTKRIARDIAVNGAYIAVMLRTTGALPAMPFSLPLYRVKLPVKALERFEELRRTKTIEEAADIIKTEYPKHVYAQASIRWALAIFSVMSLAYTVSYAYDEKDEIMNLFHKKTGDDVVKDMQYQEKETFEAARILLVQQKQKAEALLKTDLPAERRALIEDTLKDIETDLKNLAEEAAS